MVSEILFGMDESTLAYDLQRAHSADVWFIRARAWFWGITAAVACLCLGNIASVFGINIFGFMFDLLGELL